MAQKADTGGSDGLQMSSIQSSPPKSSKQSEYGLNRRSFYKDIEAGSKSGHAAFPSSLAQLDASASTEEDVDFDSREEIDSKSKMILVNVFNFVLFGNGHYKALPILWLLFSFSEAVYLNLEFAMALKFVRMPYFDAFLYTTFFIGTIANIHFGWHYMHSRLSIERTIRDCCNTLEARAKARSQLEWVTRLTFSIFIAFYVVYCSSPEVFNALQVEKFDDRVFGLRSGAFPLLMFVVCLVSGYIYYNATFYVASIWMWKCWLKNNVILSITDTISYESLMDESFIEEFEHAYALNYYHSDMWRTNHIVRVATTVPVAYVFMHVGAQAAGSFGLIVFAVGMLFYGTVWFSIVVGGYVNDNGYERALQKMNAIRCQNDTSLSEAENQKRKTNFKLHRIDALMRLEGIRMTSGIHFAGVILSTQKAVALGSVLVTLASWNVQIDTGPPTSN